MGGHPISKSYQLELPVTELRRSRFGREGQEFSAGHVGVSDIHVERLSRQKDVQG